jgi:monovalent cation/proton antiporter MnhG/PhaG subunit
MGVMDLVIDVLLAIGVAVQLMCVVGVVAMPDVFGRLHFVAPAVVGLLPIAAAIALQEGPSALGIKAAFVWAFLLLFGPVTAHATARAARIRQFGGWSVMDAERVEKP